MYLTYDLNNLGCSRPLTPMCRPTRYRPKISGQITLNKLFFSRVVNYSLNKILTVRLFLSQKNLNKQLANPNLGELSIGNQVYKFTDGRSRDITSEVTAY